MRSNKLQHEKFTLLTACVLCAVALGLFAAPADATSRVRAFVRDATLPGHRAFVVLQRAARQAFERLDRSAPDDTELAELRAELDRQQLLNRRLKLETANANERLADARREGVSPYVAAKASPLVVPELIEASVMGDDVAGAFRSLQLIDRGSAAGISESDIILQSTAPLLDQGLDAGLAPDQPVYAGRTVVGKIRDAGRWTSTIERVTDVDYRGHAQLAWQSQEGPVFGGEGILEGRGDGLCRLSKVAADQAVNVGDDVFTARLSGSLPHAMYYGQVIEADLAPGALFWDIVVKPASAQFKLQTVQVLTTRRNPDRPLAN